jgi:prolyl oligopeptidase
VLTNLEAPRYRICRVDPTRPQPEHWTDIVPEGGDVIQQHGVVGGHLGCLVLRDATSVVRLHRLDGTPVREIALPGPGTIYHWTGEADQDEVFTAYQSFVIPPTVCRHLVSTGEQTTWAQVEAPVDPSRFETRQVWFSSKDGTRVPMFLVHRRDLPRDGDRPTLLYGYGGFNAALTPFFLRNIHILLERGGMYAMANLRGGGEYGEAWHRAGMLERKQNVFDDCIAAAEWLVGEGYTRPERLAVHGVSNGGLLVGAVVTQRPDLFRAAICQVPLIDMLRYHRFDFAGSWVTEYGSSEDPTQFRSLLAYSPYHCVVDGRGYPALLITAGAADSRCDPLHARKFAARLQAANAADTPILLRVQGETGHGPGKPLSMWIDEGTDIWCFLAAELGLSR